MKYLLIAILFAACSKERPDQTCDYVFDKYFQSPSGDTLVAHRTYWFNMAKTLTPGVNPPGTFYVIQVPKTDWDAIVPATGTLYCY